MTIRNTLTEIYPDDQFMGTRPYQAAIPLGRKDLLRAGPAVRDESGRIIGCKGLAL